MDIRVLAMSLITLFASQAYSFDDCGEADGSTYFSACIARKSTDDSQLKINVLYKQLLFEYKKNKMNNARDSLVNSQQRWVKYKESECDLEQIVNGGINSVSYGRCVSRITSMRLQELEELAGERSNQ
ncbi:lysozyme inhibitor LprI family protein [Methylomonas sp. YC3]